jgi:hypothetical protein
MKLGFLRRKLIWRVERDEHFPHLVNLYDIFGRKLMTFEATPHCGNYAGDGRFWEDGKQSYADI